MKIITNNPIIIDGKSFSNDDINYSEDDFYSNGDGDVPTETPTETPKDNKANFLQTGGAVLGNVVTALASKPKRTLSDIEQRCGKKPKLGKKKIAAWQKCADSNSSAQMPSQPIPAPTAGDTKKPMSKGLKIGLIAGSVVLVSVIVYFVYKSKKK